MRQNYGSSKVRTRAALPSIYRKGRLPMNISEVLFVMAAAATILDFLWNVERWVLGISVNGRWIKTVQRSQEKNSRAGTRLDSIVLRRPLGV